MKFLTVGDVVIIHDAYTLQFGGSLGVRDENLLESAVLTCQQSFGGQDLYPTIFDKAASLFYSLLFDHPFIDGNKRAALFSTDRFLYLNGYILKMTNKEAAQFPLFVEKTRPAKDDIAKWFQQHCRKIKK